MLQDTPTVHDDRAQSRPAAGHSTMPAWFDHRREQVESALTSYLKDQKIRELPHSRLFEAVQYSVQSGGKRLRPVLVLECCTVCGGDFAHAMPAALAIEFVHTFSLIHDDLPAMDDDDLRRGRPTNHRVFGEATAILAGDWLLAHAFALLARSRGPQPALLLSEALASGTLCMIEGQAADIAGEALPPDRGLVEYIHEHKTGRLIETACRLGATAAGATGAETDALGRYGRALGLAFQIADDLLDIEGTAETTGKKVGKDAERGKQTYPRVFGIAESRARLMDFVREAENAVRPLGPCVENLRELAARMAIRDR